MGQVRNQKTLPVDHTDRERAAKEVTATNRGPRPAASPPPLWCRGDAARLADDAEQMIPTPETLAQALRCWAKACNHEAQLSKAYSRDAHGARHEAKFSGSGLGTAACDGVRQARRRMRVRIRVRSAAGKPEGDA